MLAPTAKCGKTRIRDITKWLVPNSVSVVDPSPSSIFTEITLAKQEKKTVHIAIDEFGQYCNGKRDCSEMTAIVDAGVKRGETATRTSFPGGKRQVERLETFAPMCWTGSLDKGQSQFPDSMLSRAFVINVPKRNRKTEKIKRYIERKVKPIFVELCKELSDQFGAQSDIAQRVVDGIDADIPEAVEDRVYEKYYLAIAGCKLLDMYGTDGTDGTGGTTIGRWERLCIADALEEMGDEEEIITSPEVLLLRDLCFGIVDDDPFLDFVHSTQISSNDLLNKFLALPEGIWQCMPDTKRPLTEGRMANMLREMGVTRPPGNNISIRGKDGKGFKKLKGWDMLLARDAVERHVTDYELPPVPIPARTAVPVVQVVPAVPTIEF
jgi:hypothetical protein